MIPAPGDRISVERGRGHWDGTVTEAIRTSDAHIVAIRDGHGHQRTFVIARFVQLADGWLAEATTVRRAS